MLPVSSGKYWDTTRNGAWHCQSQGASLMARASNAQARQRERGGRGKKAQFRGVHSPTVSTAGSSFCREACERPPQEGTTMPTAVLALLQRQLGGSH